MASFFTKKIVGQFFKDVAKGSTRFRELSDAEAQRDQELEAQNQREKTRQNRADERARLQREQNQAQNEARINRESDKATKAGDKAVLEGGFKAEGIRRKQKVQKDTAAAKVEAAKTKRTFDRAQQEDRQKEARNKAESKAAKSGGITNREIFNEFGKLGSAARFDFDGEDGFQKFKKQFLQATGLKVVGETLDNSQADPSAGDEAIKQAAFEAEQNQRPDLISTGNQGVDLLNQIASGRNVPQVQPETGTATDFDNPADQQGTFDQLPAEFPPDFPPIPGEQPEDGSIDITDMVDPNFFLDVNRSPAAQFANALLDKGVVERLSDIEIEWLFRYDEAVKPLREALEQEALEANAN